MGPADLLDESEHQPARVFRVNDSVYVSDIGVIERRQHLGFPLKAGHAFGIAEERRGQDFKSHVTLERSVARAVHLAPAVLAEQDRTS